MGSVEDMLKKKKLDIDDLKAPEELEEKLRTALNRTGKKHKVRRWWAAAIILIMLGGYSFDAVAYYGKKIMGYDRVTEGNLSKLNELGKGQEINESVTFSNGVTVAVDGIFFDDNKLVMLYRVKGDVHKNGIGNPTLTLKGIGEYRSQGGYGIMAEENIWGMVFDFEPPAFYEKWMKIIISYPWKGTQEEREIKVKLDRNLAMNHVVNQEINKNVEFEGIQLKFKSISASPLETKIKGSFQWTQDSKQSAGYDNWLTFDLFINDEKYLMQGSGMSSTNEIELEYENRFDGISENIKSMSIRNIRFIERDVVDKWIDFSYGTNNMEINLGKVSINIKETSFDGEYTNVKIETPNNVEVPMGLLVGNNSLEFVGSEFKDLKDSDEWTHKFKGKGEGMQMGIKVVEYVKKSSETVEIPVK